MGRNAAADERRRSERREEILSVAAEVFAQDGSNAAMDAISKRMGISKGTLYLYFPAKSDLVSAVVLRAVQRLLARLRAVANGPFGPAERLASMVKASVLFVDENRLVLRSLLETEAATRTEVRRNWARPSRALYRAVLEEGISKAIFREHDIDAVSHCAVSLGRSALFYEGSLGVEQFADETATLLVRSLLFRLPATRRSRKSRSAKESRR